jgi:hypothetical protein
MKLEFSLRIFVNTPISTVMKISPVGDELFHADVQTEGKRDRGIDRRTDRYDEANSSFLKPYLFTLQYD